MAIVFSAGRGDRLRPTGRLFGLMLFAAALSACTSSGSRPNPSSIPMGTAVALSAGTDRRWFSTCFRMPFDEHGQAVWATDLVLANEVAAPALRARAQRIPLWRFHRRAAPDAVGHQFSLMVYTEVQTYHEIQQQIDLSPTVKTLIASGHVARVVHDGKGATMAYGIEATSDQSWDPALQRAWPYFIMGVSASWLALIEEGAVGIAADEVNLPAAYAAIDKRIGELWGQQAQHAFLHHLSAVYGYRPLLLQKWLQF